LLCGNAGIASYLRSYRINTSGGRTYVEGLDAGQDAGEVGAELGVGEGEEPDAAVAVAEAVRDRKGGRRMREEATTVEDGMVGG